MDYVKVNLKGSSVRWENKFYHSHFDINSFTLHIGTALL